MDTTLSVDFNNVRIDRVVERFNTSFRWSDYSTETSGSFAVVNEAVYTLRGLFPDQGYFVYLDGVSEFENGLPADNDGVLIFTNTLDAARSFFVTPKTKGTIFLGY